MSKQELTLEELQEKICAMILKEYTEGTVYHFTKRNNKILVEPISSSEPMIEITIKNKPQQKTVRHVDEFGNPTSPYDLSSRSVKKRKLAK